MRPISFYLILLTAIPVSAPLAADFLLLTDSSLLGDSPGPDGFWSSPDDGTGISTNNAGFASASRFTSGGLSGALGFYGGSFSTASPKGTYRSGTTSISTLLFNGRISTAFGTLSFTSDQPNGSVTLNVDQTMATSLSQRTRTSFSSDIQSFTSLGGFFLLRGQDPSAVFSDQAVIDHFQFVIPLLPVDWSIVGVERFSFTTLSGTNTGSGGQATNTFFAREGARVEVGDVALDGDGFLRIGDASTGSVEIFNHHVTTVENVALLGNQAGGEGTLTVREGSLLTFTQNAVFAPFIVAGVEGTGNISVTGESELAGVRYIGLGAGTDSVGNLLVDGPGSVVNIAGHVTDAQGVVPADTQGWLSIGISGQGTATVSNGGQINISQIPGKPTSSSGIEIGGEPNGGGGSGILNVTGPGSQVTVSGDNIDFFVGRTGPDLDDPEHPLIKGTGTVNISEGGRIIYNGTGTVDPNLVGNAFIGFGGDGEVNVVGTGSELSISGGGAGMTVGLSFPETGAASGTLNVAEGGKVSLNAVGDIRDPFVSVAPFVGGTGTIVVDGPDSVLDAGQLLSISTNYTMNEFGQDPFGLFPDIESGSGAVTLKNGARIETDIGTYVGSGGTLGGNGTIAGDVFVAEGGTLTPGLSQGMLVIEGGLVLLEGSKLVLEIGGQGEGQFDIIDVSGQLTAGGTLEVVLLPGFVLDGTLDLELLSFGSFAGTFSNVILPTLGGRTLQLDIGANGISAAVVPLPASIWFLLSGIGAIVARRVPMKNRRTVYAGR